MKILILLTAVLITFLLIGSGKVFSDENCGGGWTYGAFSIPVSAQCTTVVEFCYICAGIGPNSITVNIINKYRNGSCEEDDPEPEWLISEIIKRLPSLACSIVPCGGSNWTSIAVIYPICRKYQNYHKSGLNYYLWWDWCPEDEVRCKMTTMVCWDNETQTIREWLTPRGYTCMGEIDCEVLQTWPPYPLNTEWSIGCVKRPIDCPNCSQ